MLTDVLPVGELAEHLKLDPQTVYRRFRWVELAGGRIGRAARLKRDVINRQL